MSRDPNRNELVAMWLWPEVYAAQRLGVIEWYRTLTPHQKRSVAEFMQAYEDARERDLKAAKPVSAPLKPDHVK